MKKFAVCLSAFAALCTVLACSGCAETFSLTDYARPMGSMYISELEDRPAYTKAQAFPGATSVNQLSDGLFSIETTEGELLYDARTGEYLSEPCRTIVYQQPIITLAEADGTYSYLLSDRTVIAEHLKTPAVFSDLSAYLRDAGRRDFRRMTYFVDDAAQNAGQSTERLFALDRGKNAWTEVSPQDIFVPEETSEHYRYALPERGELSGYEYSVTSASDLKIYTYYRNGTRTGSCTITGGQALGHLAGTLLYYEAIPAALHATDGYNVVYTDSFGNTKKYQISYFRYDVASGVTQPLTSDYFFLPGKFTVMFNYRTQSYDAACGEAVAFKNGVATYMEGFTPSRLITNKNLTVTADVSDLPFRVATLSQISENRYGAQNIGSGYSLLDENMNVLLSAEAQSVAIRPSSGLITGKINFQKCFAVDFDGNVVLDARYPSLEFYGSAAATTVDDGTKTLLVSPAYPNGRTCKEIIGSDIPDAQYVAHSGVILRLSSAGDAIYNYEGALLCELTEGEKYNRITEDGDYGIVQTTLGFILLS